MHNTTDIRELLIDILSIEIEYHNKLIQAYLTPESVLVDDLNQMYEDSLSRIRVLLKRNELTAVKALKCVDELLGSEFLPGLQGALFSEVILTDTPVTSNHYH